ncbi:MAG: ABC transporter permease, partial [Longimicrobiales bacterium]|nr:ABC transporter permease [Longimicrobiales bacterium]
MREIVSEVRVAFRSLAKQPGLAVLAVLALGMGIGFTAIMYSIVHGALYRGLPFPDGDRIYAVLATNPSEGIDQTSISIHDYVDWRDQQTSMEELAAYYNGTINVTAGEGPRRYNGAFMTASSFDVLGVQPALGRSFRDDEDQPGASLVLILGHQVWTDDYGSDPGVLGRSVKVNGEMATVIGVMPEGFRFPNVEQVWVPLRADPLASPRGEGHFVTPFGKLPDGISPEQAQVEYSGIAGRIAEQFPETNEGLDAKVMLYTDTAMGGEGEAIMLSMLATVFLVLILACVNVANLLLARAAGRTKELAIRSAMGAGRSRVLALLLSEAVVLSLGGAIVGIAIAKVGIDVFARLAVDTEPPFWFVFALDGPILLFIVVSTVVAALVAGLIPGLKVSSGGRLNELLKDESRGSSSMRIGKLSRLLVMGEVAMSVGLLVTAGLMVKGMIKLRTMEYGFDRAEVFTARIGLFPNDFPDDESKSIFFRDLQDGLEARSEVTRASLSDVLPGLGSGVGPFAMEGGAYPTERDYPRARGILVSPGYFETFGVQPLQGRTFDRGDDREGLPVALVNESFVGRYSPGEDVLGKRVRRGGAESEEPWLTIVGVVPDLFMEGLGNDRENTQGMYRPLAQADAQFVSIAVRGMGDPASLAPIIRDEVARHSPDTPIYWPRTLQEALDSELWWVDLFGGLFAIFGLGALFLAAVGLYGVTAFSVRQRTHEVGIRMALGAGAGKVLGMVLRQGAVQVLVGLVVGLGLGALLSRGLRQGFTLVEPWDSSVFIGISLVLLATAFVATL